MSHYIWRGVGSKKKRPWIISHNRAWALQTSKIKRQPSKQLFPFFQTPKAMASEPALNSNGKRMLGKWRIRTAHTSLPPSPPPPLLPQPKKKEHTPSKQSLKGQRTVDVCFPPSDVIVRGQRKGLNQSRLAEMEIRFPFMDLQQRQHLLIMPCRQMLWPQPATDCKWSKPQCQEINKYLLNILPSWPDFVTRWQSLDSPSKRGEKKILCRNR